MERPSRLRPLLIGATVGLATAILMLATEPRLVIAWDEGYTLGREARLRDWFRALADPPGFAARWTPPVEELVQYDKTPAPRGHDLDTRSKLLFDRQVVTWFWPFAREEPHGHPPFYALLGLAGDVLAPSWPDLPRTDWVRSSCSASRRGRSSCSRRPDGATGRQPWPHAHGPCSRTCSVTDIMPATTAS